MTPEIKMCTIKTFAIGGSHSRTVRHMPQDTISLAEPGFVSTQTAVSRIAQRLLGDGLSPTDTVVMDLLSKLLDGERIKTGFPNRAETESITYVPSSLTTNPPHQ